MAEPLNKALYLALKQVDSGITVAHQGEAADIRVETDPVKQRRFARVLNMGERYNINCPFCGDTRRRLGISHVQGMTYNGCRLNSANCFNERCQVNNKQFKSWINDICRKGYSDIAVSTNRPVHIAEAKSKPRVFPETAVPVLALDPEHSVRHYLERVRRIPVNEIAAVWALYWSAYSFDYASRSRIIIPVIDDSAGSLNVVGWQARYFDALTGSDVPPLGRNGKPLQKYLSLFPKSSYVYNSVMAKREPFAVLVEGPFDAMALGRTGIALFGKDMSRHQEKIIYDNWLVKSKPVIVAMDRDARDASEAIVARFKAADPRADVFVCEYPDGVDEFGDVTRPEAAAILKHNLENYYARKQ